MNNIKIAPVMATDPKDSWEFHQLAATILGGLLANGSYVGVEDKAVEMTERLLSAIERSKKC